jgi:DUF971 family protein
MRDEMEQVRPADLHLRKDAALEVEWGDGRRDVFPLRFLRKHCPCAGCKGEKDLFGKTILPILKTTYDGEIRATGGELVGNYAIRIDFSDGHNSGIFTWKYLRELGEEIGNAKRET